MNKLKVAIIDTEDEISKYEENLREKNNIELVGAFSGRFAKYSSPPTCSSFDIVSSSFFNVIKSIGSALLYKFCIASYIALSSSL